MIYTQRRYTMTYRRLVDEYNLLWRRYKQRILNDQGNENDSVSNLLAARMDSTLGKIEREESWMVGTGFYPNRHT